MCPSSGPSMYCTWVVGGFSDDIDWTNCVGLSTDRAQAMMGRLNGVAKMVKAVAPLMTTFHCYTHREALAVKTMSAN